jgi:hypothetical protein
MINTDSRAFIAETLKDPDWHRRCAEVHYRSEGYAPVGFPALDTGAFLDVLRGGGWAPRWSSAHGAYGAGGLWVPAWVPPILAVALQDGGPGDLARIERYVSAVARVLWRVASKSSDDTLRAVRDGFPEGRGYNHPVELDMLTILWRAQDPAAIRAHLTARGVALPAPG